jgi:4-carboxymuconolactone decarboxylase
MSGDLDQGCADVRLRAAATRYAKVLYAEETLRRLAIAGPTPLPSITELDNGDHSVCRLDERTEALVRVGVLVALDAPETSYHAAVEAATLAGATLDDLVATLLTVAGSVGSARVMSAAPRLALAAGYDIDSALESSDPVDL